MGDEVKTEPNGNDAELNKMRWKNRRRMAWVSLCSMVFVTAAILFTDIVEIERLKVLTEVITWFYFSCASVIGAYMGFTTYARVKGKD
jgi:hypothetical protein